MYSFKLLSDWLLIESISDIDSETGFRDVFYLDQTPYYIDDFVRVHNSAWIDDTNYPDYIHGMEIGPIDNPLFIELSDDGEQVRAYQFIEDDEDGSRCYPTDLQRENSFDPSIVQVSIRYPNCPEMNTDRYCRINYS